MELAAQVGPIQMPWCMWHLKMCSLSIYQVPCGCGSSLSAVCWCWAQ